MGIPISNLNSSIKYNTATSLFNSLPEARSGAMENLTNTVLGNNSAISLTDYAALKNGSYKTMMKAYVNKAMEGEDEASSDGTVTKKKAAAESTPNYNRDATTALSTEKVNRAKAEETKKEADKARSGYTADGAYSETQAQTGTAFSTTL